MARKLLYVCMGLLSTGLVWSGGAQAVVLHQPGYTVNSFVSLPASANQILDIELDAIGNLYISTQPDGIRRVTPLGAMSLWSTAPAIDMTLSSTADGYGAGASCHCIVSLSADGSYSILHADSYEWRYVNLGPDGKLYAAIWAGDGQGLYLIDRTTGTPTLLVSGGPGPDGAGWYFHMVFGLDGKLYTLGYDGTDNGLFRLDAGGFTRVVTLPLTGMGLTQDPSGMFYATATTNSEVSGEVWTIDAASGTASLLASGLTWPYAIAFDPLTARLYVAEQLGERTVYAISKSDLPISTQRTTWGGIKALYR